MARELAFLHPPPKEVTLLGKLMKIDKTQTKISVKSTSSHLKHKILTKLSELGLNTTDSQKEIENQIRVILEIDNNIIPHKNGYKLIIE